jgi:hypothetical protein
MHGHRIGAPLGMGYVHNRGGVTRDWCEGSSFEVEVAGDCVPASAAQLAPFYDRKMDRVKV